MNVEREGRMMREGWQCKQRLREHPGVLEAMMWLEGMDSIVSGTTPKTDNAYR